MKNHSGIQFYSELGILLILLEINATVISLEELRGIQPCKIINDAGCVISCSHCELDSENVVKGLKEIISTEGQELITCTLIIKFCTLKNRTIGTQDENPSYRPQIDNLKIFHSWVDINDFSPLIFRNVRELTIQNTTTVSLQSKAFRHFPNLQKLQIKRVNTLKWVEKGFLQNLALHHLQIQGMNLTQLETVRFFKNLTAAHQIQSIRELDWSYNNFGYFEKDLLAPFPHLNVLILTNCNIFNFEEKTFNNISIKNVHLNNNKIETILEKIFRPLMENASFVSFEGNPLACDCRMKWLQNLANKHTFRINCLETELCSDNSSAVHCSPKENLKISTDYNSWSNATKSKDAPRKFLVKNDEPKFLKVTLADGVDVERAFLWYGNYANTTSPQFNCLKIREREFSIYVMPDVSYLVCFAMIYKYFQIDIFDCLPLKTKPLHQNQSWLTKKSIPLSIICIFIVFLFALAVGALILYLSIRKNPSLIRGSKRVIKVKRHDKAQLLIMPRGYENVRQREGFSGTLMDSSLPQEPSMSCDTISTVSYVSANQPTQLEILTYRLNRLRELFQRNNNLPSGVSSLPMQMAIPINQRLPPNVDLLFEYEWYTITTTTET